MKNGDADGFVTGFVYAVRAGRPYRKANDIARYERRFAFSVRQRAIKTPPRMAHRLAGVMTAAFAYAVADDDCAGVLPPSGSDGSAGRVCRTAQRLQAILLTLGDMNRSLEDVVEALGRVAAEIDEVATDWASVDEQSPGPALLRNWRAQIVFSLMVLREHPADHPEARSRT